MTVVVFGAVVAGVLLSPGWPSVHELFFNGHHARESFHEILKGFWINVKLFMICEPCILVAGLAIALARNARSPWLTPLRIVAVVYTDVVRGIPTILLVVLFAFGFPALQLQGIPDSLLFWAGTALVVSYSAYVAEVFRAGIDSIHPSQVNSASALGLSRGQAMRFVVVPQAVRRVVPPAAQRLRLAAEGHRARLVGGVVRRAVQRPRLRELQLQLHATGRRGRVLRRVHGAPRPLL